MYRFLRREISFLLKGREEGTNLIENIVGVAIFGLIGLAFIGGTITAVKATSIADERAISESLARSQMEYIKSQSFSSNAWDYTSTSAQRSATQPPSWWDAANPPLLASTYAGYSVSAIADDFDADGDGGIEVPGDDQGIRKITLHVYHPSSDPNPLITLQDYHKVDR